MVAWENNAVEKNSRKQASKEEFQFFMENCYGFDAQI